MAKSEPKSIELKGPQIFRLRVLESGRKYSADSKLKDDTYSRISYNGTVFTINDKDPFLGDLKNGKVHTAFLIESTEDSKDAEGNVTQTTRLALEGYVNNAQMIGLTKTESVLSSILSGNFKADAELTDEDLAVFEEAAS
jgi:hypothetical protein